VNTDRQKVSMLMILQATCQTTLQAFHAADNALDVDFAADLERIIARTQAEIDALNDK
jgi:hypothetical protein